MTFIDLSELQKFFACKNTWNDKIRKDFSFERASVNQYAAAIYCEIKESVTNELKIFNFDQGLCKNDVIK